MSALVAFHGRLYPNLGIGGFNGEPRTYVPMKIGFRPPEELLRVALPMAPMGNPCEIRVLSKFVPTLDPGIDYNYLFLFPFTGSINRNPKFHFLPFLKRKTVLVILSISLVQFFHSLLIISYQRGFFCSRRHRILLKQDPEVSFSSIVSMGLSLLALFYLLVLLHYSYPLNFVNTLDQ
jgi:hypothetical protein